MDETRCTRGVPHEQCHATINGQLAYGIDQSIRTGVVEPVGDLHPIGWKLIIDLEQLQGLLSANRAGAQHRIDRDVAGSQVVTRLACLPFAVRVSRRSLSRLPGRTSSVWA